MAGYPSTAPASNTAGFDAFGSAPMPHDPQAYHRQAIVNAMMQQAANSSPALSWTQGLDRGTAGIAAGLLSDPNWKLGSIFGAPKPVSTSAPVPAPMNSADMY